MILKELCPPAFIYLIFSLSQIIIDAVKGYFNTALVKVFTTFIFTYLLNFMCNAGLGIISWIIVFIPFILMTIISVLLLGLLGLHPKTGRLNNYTKQDNRMNNYAQVTTHGNSPLIQNNGLTHTHQRTHTHGHKHDNNNRNNNDDNPFNSNNNNINEVSYGVDKNDRESKEEEEVDYDKLAIQKNTGRSNTNYKWYSRLYSGNQKFGKRREYVKIVRNILIDMNEGNEAAAFQNQSENCIGRKTDQQFETCLKILCMDTGEKLGRRKKQVFFKKLKSRNII